MIDKCVQIQIGESKNSMSDIVSFVSVTFTGKAKENCQILKNLTWWQKKKDSCDYYYGYQYLGTENRIVLDLSLKLCVNPKLRH